MKNDDIVRIGKGKNCRYGNAFYINRETKKADVRLIPSGRIVVYRVDRLTVMPPFVPAEAEMRRFARLEIGFDELFGAARTTEPENDFTIRPGDILTALHALRDDPDGLDGWFERMNWLMCDWPGCLFEKTPSMYDEIAPEGLERDADASMRIMSFADNVMEGGNELSAKERVEMLIREVERICRNLENPLSARMWTNREKERFLCYWHRNDNDEVNRAPKEVQIWFRRFAEELAVSDNETALHVIGYGCYTGGPMWEQNWMRARDCFIKLMGIAADNRFYANTLGYIYYYGRCNGGVPQYEEAYRYFSLAAFGGVYEARYKIADMYKNGYGVDRNRLVAFQIVAELYEENIKNLYNGETAGKFADVALRMGAEAKERDDLENALFYLTQADFAIRERMKAVDYYGDTRVAASIAKALGETREKTDFGPVKYERASFITDLLRGFKEKNLVCEADVKTQKNGDRVMTIQVNKHSARDGKRLFVTLPHVGRCLLVKTIKVRMHVCFEEAEDTSFRFDSLDEDVFCYCGEPVYKARATEYRISVPAAAKGEKYRFVSVEFTEGGKTYDYRCDDENVRPGDEVTVETREGKQTVKVVCVYEKSESELTLPLRKYGFAGPKE